MNLSKVKLFAKISVFLLSIIIIFAFFSKYFVFISFKNNNCVSIYLKDNDKIKYKRTFNSDRKGDFLAINSDIDSLGYYFNLEMFYNEPRYRGSKNCEYENSNDLFKAINSSIYVKKPGAQDCNGTSIENNDFYFGYNKNKNTYVTIKCFKEKNCHMNINIDNPDKALKYKVYTHLNESKEWEKMYFSVLEFNTNVKPSNLCWLF